MAIEHRFQKLYQAYKILEVVPTLDPDTIKDAFRLLAQIYHPDKFTTEEDKNTAHKQFVKISNAKDYILETILKTDVIDAFDSTPLTIGFEKTNGLLEPIIRIGTIIPLSTIQSFEINPDEQGNYTFKLFQGVRPIACDNTIVGVFSFLSESSCQNSISPLKVEAVFSVDEMGIFRIERANNSETGKELTVKMVELGMGMSENDIDVRKRQAFESKMSDRKRVNKIKG